MITKSPPVEIPGAPAAPAAEDFARDRLRQILELYGRALCGEPQLCEALLHDFCPQQRREVFLITAALREGAVRDLLNSSNALPEDLLLVRVARQLCDNVGLAEEPSRWAVDSWYMALQAVPYEHGPRWVRREAAATSAESPGATATATRTTGSDRRWVALCAGAVGCSALALATMTRLAFYHHLTSLTGWTIDTTLLAASLGIAGMGEDWIARQLSRTTPPPVSLGDPRVSPAALLLEVMVLLSLPLTALGAPALWFGEWYTSAHVSGASHDLAFHLGRILQTLLLAAFLWRWVLAMPKIQGRIACSLLRSR